MINENINIDIIFYTQSLYQKWNLLKGILQSINPEYSHEGSIEDEFLKENLHIKIWDCTKKLFIANLTDCEQKVLEEINSKEKVKTYDIIEIFKDQTELHEITSAIEKLKLKKFIYSTGDRATELLISINIKIKNYE